jgi:formate-dependent nitrite reductase membrane component NrfD
VIDAPSSTWFTTNPHWQWYIVLYFFIGGLAGGCYFIATLIDQVGRAEDRPLARLGYYVAFPCVVVSGLLLTVDLSRPLRFWHMLIERNTFEPMFKAYSPMSFGSWGLLAFGFFSFLAFLGAFAEEDSLRWPALRHARWPALRVVRSRGVLGRVIALLGGISALFIAGYTGVLLAVTNRPIWADTPLLGMLFIVSAASTSTALLMLLAQRYGWQVPGVASLQRMDRLVLVLELLVLAAVMMSLGAALRGWLNAWGLLLLVGVIILGLIAPLMLSWRHHPGTRPNITTVATLVLVGGFLLRIVVIFSSETI